MKILGWSWSGSWWWKKSIMLGAESVLKIHLSLTKPDFGGETMADNQGWCPQPCSESALGLQAELLVWSRVQADRDSSSWELSNASAGLAERRTSGRFRTGPTAKECHHVGCTTVIVKLSERNVCDCFVHELAAQKRECYASLHSTDVAETS